MFVVQVKSQAGKDALDRWQGQLNPSGVVEPVSEDGTGPFGE